jgi:hypothetical protein
MLWSRLLFQIFAKPILNIDATLVSVLLGTDRSGNMVGFLDGSGYMIVLPACSSLANMSLACPGAKSPALGWDRDLIRRLRGFRRSSLYRVPRTDLLRSAELPDRIRRFVDAVSARIWF